MFNVYGPGQNMNNLMQGMVSIYLSQALKNRKIIVKGSLSRFRDFIYIDDVVEIWYRAAFSENSLNKEVLTVFGNLPYNISTEILSKWILNLDDKSFWFDVLVLMFQKEVAERICEKKGSKKIEAKSAKRISNRCIFPLKCPG